MQLKPLQFGTVTIDYPVVLAPMAGYTDSALRTLCLEQGAGAVYTELASSEGLSRDGGRTFQVLEPAADEHPIAGHIFGRDPQAMAEAAKMLEQDGRFDWIDINCGCPVKKVVSRGAGAALIKDLSQMSAIIRLVKAAVTLPVSVKTRIGFNSDHADHLQIGKVIEESGADMVAVHARLAKNFHGGDPDWETLGEMKQALSIPVIGNGGVFSPADAEQMVAVSGVDGVMIGRGAIGNPWIFAEIQRGRRDACDTKPVETAMERTVPQESRLPIMERRDMIAEHLRRLVELNERKQKNATRPIKYTAEAAACIQFRTHIPYYVKGMFDKKRLLMKLASLITVEEIMEEIDILVEKNEVTSNS